MTNSQSLTGRCALITGAAKRLGAGTTHALHAAGANVVIHYHDSEAQARDLANTLNSARPGSASLFRSDLLDAARLTDLVAHAAATFGGLDILVNNASTFYPTPIGSITLDQWDDLMGTNLKAPLFLAQAAVPHLRKRQGLIINMVD